MWSLEKWLASGAIRARGRFPKKILLSKPVMDEKISGIFQEWLSAFDAMQVASGEEAEQGHTSGFLKSKRRLRILLARVCGA